MGKFRIDNAPEGIYDLIFDCIGYETKVIKIHMIQALKLSFTVELKPKIYRTDQIQIIAEKPKEWLERLEIFIREFIGQSSNARECIILNPEFLEFQIDSVTHNFLAFSDSTLRIRNNALGYHINVKLVQFEYSRRKNTCLYEMYPSFRELRPADTKQYSKWIDNRKNTFKGSLRHFLSSLIRDQYYPLFKLYIDRHTEKIYVKADMVHLNLVKNSSLLKMSFEQYIGFDEFLRIDSDLFDAPHTCSMLRLDRDYALIDSLGNIYGPITKRGAWADERMADLLPYDYDPNTP
jgi:hypothetical protein